MPTKREITLRKFGRALAEARQEQGLTQEALAQRASLHPNYIGDLERGERNPTLMTIVALAHGLGVDPPSLIGRAFG